MAKSTDASLQPAQRASEAHREMQAMLRAQGLKQDKDEVIRLKLAKKIQAENEAKYKKRLEEDKRYKKS